MLRLTRHPEPILKPLSHHPWESRYVFNAGVVYHNGLVHMLYRAMGEDMSSRLGYAVSPDGLTFYRLDRPVLSPTSPWEARGVEDPRITLLEGRFYVVYTAYSGSNVRVSMASTMNFITWTHHGILLPDEDNKDAALFPERINGRYAMLHRRPPDIWLAYSEDLTHWTDHQVIMRPRPGTWESWKIGAGAPPIKTEWGWLLFYHGVDHHKVYRLGVALLDLEDPTRVIRRQEAPILSPEAPWEREGQVPNVVFTCGAVEIDGTYYVYYGGADTVIGVATVPKEDVERFCRGR
ncbi:MAG TPA: hypothetical protein VNK89_08280 [Thermoflexus sp.]|nr:hypothetical protein [Thermoflexus sp.]